jgi:hypothetical protein
LRSKKEILKNNKGQSTLEFVMVMPLIIILVLAAAQIGLTVYARMQMQQASREAARIIATTNKDGLAIKAVKIICGEDVTVIIDPGDPQNRRLGDIVNIKVSRKPEGLHRIVEWVSSQEVILNAEAYIRMECGYGDF